MRSGSSPARAARMFAVLVVFVVSVPMVAAQQPGKPTVPDSVAFESGIEYTNPDGQHLQLDMARPKTGNGPFPAILCIHGGGFRAGNRQSFDSLCVRLAEQGYVAATITYRLAPK